MCKMNDFEILFHASYVKCKMYYEIIILQTLGTFIILKRSLCEKKSYKDIWGLNNK